MTLYIPPRVGPNGYAINQTEDGYGVPLTALTITPAGTETGLIVRNIPSGTQTVSGTLNATQSGNWTIRTQDGYGTPLTAMTTTPVGTETGLVVRIAGASAGGTSSSFSSAFPASGTAAGFTDGTNMQPGRVFDVDTSGGTQYIQGVNLRLSSSGGSVEAATPTNPLRIDPTGTTNQPILAKDGYGTPLTAMSTTPTGNETALVVRIAGASAGGTSSSFNSAFPASGTAAGFTDGVNMQAARVFDADTGGGTQYVMGVNLRLSGNGGSVEAGTNTNPLFVKPEDGYGTPFTALTIAPSSSEVGLVVRNIPSGTQVISGTVSANQSGTWTINNDDGYGRALTALTGTPTGTETGLVTRNIPSGTQAVSGTVGATQSGTWIVNIDDGYGRALTALTGVPSGTETGLVTRNIPSGIQSVSQSGTWTINTDDGYGRALTALTGTPVGTETGLVVRNIPSGTQTITTADGYTSGTITSNQSVSFTSLNGASTVGVTITGGWVGTILPQISVDGLAWINTTAIAVSSGAISSSITSGGSFQINVSGMSAIRLVGSTVTSGTASIMMRSSTSPALVMFDNPLPSGSNNIGSFNTNDGYGRSLTGLTGTPAGTEVGLVTRSLSYGISNTSQPSFSNGAQGELQIDAHGNLYTMYRGADTIAGFTISSNGTRNAIVSSSSQMMGTLVIFLNSVGTGGKIQVQSSDGSNFYALPALNMNTGVISTTISAIGLYQVNMAGLTSLWVQAVALTSGSITGNFTTGPASSLVSIGAPVSNLDGYGNYLTALTGNPSGTETGLVTRNIPSGTQSVSQSGTWTMRTQDGYGIPLTALASTPVGNETGLVVRIAGASAGGTSSSFSSAFPASGTAAGFTDGVNMQPGRVFDVDSGGGTQYVQGVNIRASSSGGSVEAGTATNPFVISGSKTSNNASPGATNVGVLAAVANAAAPTFTEGNLVALSTDLSGALRISGSISASTSATATASAPSYTEGVASNLSQTLSGQLRILSHAVVNDTIEQYNVGAIQPLSLTTEGRLRVTSVTANTYLDFFGDDDCGEIDTESVENVLFFDNDPNF